jgi:probable DNA repair protein
VTAALGATLVVKDGLAARQWEAQLHDEALDTRNAWLSPRLLTMAGWRRELWAGVVADSADILNAHQCDALWRQIITASSHGAGLIDCSGPAVWAADAWRLLAAWKIDPNELRASSAQPDFAAFLRWCGTYRARLRDSNWVDPPEIQLQLQSKLVQSRPPPAAPVELLDLADSTPARTELLRCLSELGWRIEPREAPGKLGSCRRLALQDADTELRAAVQWAALRSQVAPRARFAIVVSDLGRRHADLARSLDALGEFRDLGAALTGRVSGAVHVRDNPFVGAALNAIELLSPRGAFAHLSRWLRSPFMTGGDVAQASAAARVENELRSELLAQLGFLEAYGQAGLRGRLHGAVPEFAARLDAALQEVALQAPIKTPTAWAMAWHRALEAMGWSRASQAVEPAARLALESALDRFAQLTPILGGLSCTNALHELESLLGRRQLDGPLSLTGLHVFSHVDQVGPGYSGVWVTGLTDTSWPEPARMNPLLPRALQIAHDMPWASPADALARSAASLQRLRTRVDEVIFSWPKVQYDYRTEPSGLVAHADPITAEELGLADVRTESQAIGARPLQTLTDPAPPLAGHRINGGAGTLDLQARCPIRAFCQSRLGARAIEPPRRGLSPRVQGILIHRALELLMGGIWADGDSFSIRAARGRIVDAARAALDETFGAAGRHMTVIYELELDRLRLLLGRFLDMEAMRSPYRIEALEQRRDVECGTRSLRVRIDRVDRLDDGGLAIIDYKTGRSIKAPKWFADRLEETQLPLYALDRGAAGTSLVVVALSSERTRYLGIWGQPDSFPGRGIALPEARAWEAQLTVWRNQIDALVTEYAAGDVRLSPAATDLAKGAHAPLTRVYELMRRYHGRDSR